MSTTLSMRLKNRAITQYRNYQFNSAAKIGNVYMAASGDGLYEIDAGTMDNDRVISSETSFPTSDFGDSRQKRIRRYYVSGRFWGQLEIETTDDDGNTRTFPLVPEKTDGSLCSAVANVAMDSKGRYWKTRIKSSGVDFSINKVDVKVITLNRKPSGVI